MKTMTVIVLNIGSCLFKVGLNAEEESQKLNLNLISRLSKESDVLVHAHDAIFGILSETEEYVKTWTSYQALWDLQYDQVYSRIGNNPEVYSTLFLMNSLGLP